MIIILGIIFILVLSLFLAIRSLADLETPEEIKKLMKKKSGASGVILFLKKKIVHYSSSG